MRSDDHFGLSDIQKRMDATKELPDLPEIPRIAVFDEITEELKKQTTILTEILKELKKQ